MKRSSAQAHAKHPHYCSCGTIVHGNGAKYQHKQMHLRKGDGERWMTRDAYGVKFLNEGVKP